MLLAIWNIVQIRCDSSWEEKHFCLLLRNQTICLCASSYQSFSSVVERKTEKDTSPRGISNPPLVCTAAAIQQNKIIPVAAYNLDLQMKW